MQTQIQKQSSRCSLKQSIRNGLQTKLKLAQAQTEILTKKKMPQTKSKSDDVNKELIQQIKQLQSQSQSQKKTSVITKEEEEEEEEEENECQLKPNIVTKYDTTQLQALTARIHTPQTQTQTRTYSKSEIQIRPQTVNSHLSRKLALLNKISADNENNSNFDLGPSPSSSCYKMQLFEDNTQYIPIFLSSRPSDLKFFPNHKLFAKRLCFPKKVRVLQENSFRSCIIHIVIGFHLPNSLIISRVLNCAKISQLQ
jgi:hypothetical protein